MDNVSEVVALLRQQAVLENRILTTGRPAVAAEWALATTRRRLVAYPEALAAVLHTARALSKRGKPNEQMPNSQLAMKSCAVGSMRGKWISFCRRFLSINLLPLAARQPHGCLREDF